MYIHSAQKYQQSMNIVWNKQHVKMMISERTACKNFINLH